MKIVGAGFGDDIHYRSGVLPVFRTVVTGLDAELLKRVGKRKRLIDVSVFVYVVSAVELVADHILARAVGRNRDGPGKRLCRALVGASIGRVHSARHEQRELRRVAALQRHLNQTLLFDDLFQR